MDQYAIKELLGDGAYGSVYRAVHIPTSQVVAIKKLKEKYYTWESCMALKEIKSQRKLSHPNVVKLKEVLREDNTLYFIFEFLNCNLYQLIKDRRAPLPESQIRSIALQILKGTQYIHKEGYIHRDLKPENILVSGNTVKIGDFGLAKEVRARPPFTEYVSTRWYRAPELLLRASYYNTPIDIYAIGTIIAELYLQRPLFPGSCERDQIGKILEILGTPTDEQWPDYKKLSMKFGSTCKSCMKIPLERIITNASKEAIDLLCKMLCYNPNTRATATECLAHPYFTGRVDELNGVECIPKSLPVSFPILKSKENKENRGEYNNTTSFKNNVQFPLLKVSSNTELKFNNKIKKQLPTIEFAFPSILLGKENKSFPITNKPSYSLPSLFNKNTQHKAKPLGRAPLGCNMMMDIKKININI